ncbi:MAG: putative transcriptional regulator [Solirubrobacterales bacterium]|nr:putative transcriptional regulator [Solirubrobacterales bacterium]
MVPNQRNRDLEIAKAFGARVRELRMEAGLTQERLAEAAGLHPTFISNVERGYRVPSVPTMLRLAVALAVAPSDLVDKLTA